MIRHRIARTRTSINGFFLTVVLALALVGAAIAQSQLPGTRLTTDPTNDLRPAWSPDGAYIAFFSSRSGNNEIWVMDADGGNQRQLTDDPADDRRPAWSPSGNWLAFDSDRGGSRHIWIMGTDGANPRQLTDGPALDSFPAWSPDGGQIAFYSLRGGVLDIWAMDVTAFLQTGEAEQPRRVTTGVADQSQNQCTFACHVPAWSPDGARIAYTGNNHTQVWVVGADGSNPHPLADNAVHDHFPWWTPDGKILYLNEHVVGQQEELVNDVWLMDANGQHATLLFPDIPHGGPFYWHPDGSTTIAFQSPRNGNFDIYMTVLGEAGSTPQPMVATEVTGPLGLGPTSAPPATATPAAEPVAPASRPADRPDLALIWVVSVFVAGGGLMALYLAQRGRTP